MEKTKKYKIAFIHPDLGIGGAERLVLDVAIALAEKGNNVLFVTNHFDRTHAFEELQDNRFPVRIVGDWIPRSVCGICQALCAYIRMIYLALMYVFFIRNEDKPDVYFIDQIPMAVPFIKWAGGKVVYYCHHPDLLASSPGGTLKKIYRLPINWLEMKGTAMADVLLVNSKYTATVFRKTFPEITKDIEILYPNISSSYRSTILNATRVKSVQELVPEIQTSKNNVVFLSINRYHPAKKLELALNGLEALKSKLSPDDWSRVHLIIAGGFDPQSSVNAVYFSKLVEICEAKNLIMKVTFLKSPSDDLKADLLLACDCLIYTPINEHFGIVPLEAMTASKPVIACNSGGPCETVQHEVTGYLCDPTPDSLADAMSKMLNKTTSYNMGISGKERLEKYFSHTTFTVCVNNVINKLLNTGIMLDVTQPAAESSISHTTSFAEKQCHIPLLQTEVKQKSVNVEVSKNISEKQIVQDFIEKEITSDYVTSSTDKIDIHLSPSSTTSIETGYLTPVSSTQVGLSDKEDLKVCFLSPSDFSRGNSETDLDRSLVSTTDTYYLSPIETCYFSPPECDDGNTQLNISNISVFNEDVEIVGDVVQSKPVD